MSVKSKIIDLNNPGKGVNRYNGGDGGGNMDDYVTQSEFKISELKTQNKLDRLESKIDSLSDKVDTKFNQIPGIIENAMLKEREYQRVQQRETRRFFWGTIIIGGISAVAGVISVIVSIW